MRALIMLVIIHCSLLVSCQIKAQTTDVIQVRTIAISPYGIRREHQQEGIYFELANDLMKLSGYTSVNYLYPYARIIEELKSGQTDLTIMFRYKALQNDVIYIAPLPPLQTVVIGLKGSQFPSPEALIGKKIAYLRGARFSDVIDNNSEIYKHETSTISLGLKMLIKGRVDAIIGPIDPILSAAARENTGVSEDKKIYFGQPLVVDERTPWVQISKKSRHRLSEDRLRSIFSDMINHGKLEQLRKKYLPASSAP